MYRKAVAMPMSKRIVVSLAYLPTIFRYIYVLTSLEPFLDIPSDLESCLEEIDNQFTVDRDMLKSITDQFERALEKGSSQSIISLE